MQVHSESLGTIESQEKHAEQEADDRVRALEQESAEFKKIFQEISALSPEEAKLVEQGTLVWAAAYNLRVRKMQRDKEAYLGASPSTRQDRSNKIDKLIFKEVPPSAYVSYLEEQVGSLRMQYEKTKKEYDQLHEEQNNLSAKAQTEQNPVKRKDLMDAAAKKMQEKNHKLWIIQNTIFFPLQPDLDKDIKYVESHILPQAAAHEQGKLAEKLNTLKNDMDDLGKKTQQARLSSEDKPSVYFSK